MDTTRAILKEVFDNHYRIYPHLAFDWADNGCCDIHGMTINHDDYIVTIHTERGDWEYAY